MWQILWMLTFVPDWIYQAILILGVIAVFAAYFLKIIPVVSAYSKGLKATGIILIIIGVWFNGQLTADAKWKTRVADLQSKIAESERQAEEANAQIEYVYVDRLQIVEKIRYQVVGSIRELSNEIDANCTVNPKAVEILNRSAETLNKAAKK